MMIVWILGLMLAFHLDAWGQGWFIAKLALVVALTGYQGWLGAYGKKLARGERPLSGKAVRMHQRNPRHRRGADRRAGDRPAVLDRVRRLPRALLIDSGGAETYLESERLPASFLTFAGAPFLPHRGVLPPPAFDN